MPTYEYVCNACGADLEIVQSMAEPSLTVCPECGDEGLRKLFRGVGIHFKGSGFYRTDSKESKKSGASATKAESASKTDSSSAASSSSTKSDSGSSSGSASTSSASSSTSST